MRSWWAIVRATTLEMTSEPLALLITLSAAAMVSIAAAFHLHQFGEPSRMAREAGLSALLVFGLAYAVFCTIRVFRREIESGTAQMALSHPVSRAGFFLSKVAGAVGAYLVFAVTTGCVVLVTTIGAETGGLIAAVKGDIPLVWGPAIALDTAVMILPLAVAAALNRFASRRFTVNAVRIAFLLAPVALAIAAVAARMFCASAFPNAAYDVLASARRLVRALVAVVLPAPVFATAAAAFAVRFKGNAAASLSAALFAVSLPALSGYYLSDALAKGGSPSWGYVAVAAAATLPFLAAFAVLGISLFGDRDVG